MPSLAPSETIPLFLLLLLLLKRCSVLLFEYLLEFLLVGVLRIFLHHMGTRTSLNSFLATDVLCSRLLFNIQRANELGNAKLLSLMFQGLAKYVQACGGLAMI